jgi:hypothetical protein
MRRHQGKTKNARVFFASVTAAEAHASSAAEVFLAEFSYQDVVSVIF